MKHLSQQRCHLHSHREAVARCPECRRFFCRECVTEHDERMLCRDCLTRLSGVEKKGTNRWRYAMATSLQGISGFLLLWYLFFWVGRILLAIPNSFHEGTIWENIWWKLP